MWLGCSHDDVVDIADGGSEGCDPSHTHIPLPTLTVGTDRYDRAVTRNLAERPAESAGRRPPADRWCPVPIVRCRRGAGWPRVHRVADGDRVPDRDTLPAATRLPRFGRPWPAPGKWSNLGSNVGRFAQGRVGHVFDKGCPP